MHGGQRQFLKLDVSKMSHLEAAGEHQHTAFHLLLVRETLVGAESLHVPVQVADHDQQGAGLALCVDLQLLLQRLLQGQQDILPNLVIVLQLLDGPAHCRSIRVDDPPELLLAHHVHLGDQFVRLLQGQLFEALPQRRDSGNHLLAGLFRPGRRIGLDFILQPAAKQWNLLIDGIADQRDDQLRIAQRGEFAVAVGEIARNQQKQETSNDQRNPGTGSKPAAQRSQLAANGGGAFGQRVGRRHGTLSFEQELVVFSERRAKLPADG